MSNSEDLETIDYSFPKLGKSKWITLTVGIFLLGIIIYFPFMFKVKSLVKTQMHKIPGCSVDYQDIKLEFFLPKVIVKNLVVPQSCFGKYGDPLKMSKVFLYFRGFSFSPFGPHFKIETQLNDIPLSSYLTTGFGTIALNIKENEIDLSKLRKLIPTVNLSGKIKIDALVKLNGKDIDDLKLNIRSKDFTLPGQTIQGFKLATMRLNNLLLKANKKGKKLILESFIIGDDDAPIRSNFKGNVTLNQRNLTASQLDLIGEVAFSSKFLESYAIIKLVMNKFDKKDEFYQIKLTGPLMRPKPSSPR